MIKYFLGIILLVTSCGLNSKNKNPENSETDWPTKQWTSLKCTESGLDSLKMDSISNSIDRKFSIMITQGGKIIYEKYKFPYSKDSLMHTNSCTKTVISLLFGMIFQEDLNKYENYPAISFFPEFVNSDTTVLNIQNRHFLSMTSGLEWKGGIDATDNIKMSNTDNWAEYVFTKSFTNSPGERFHYNSGGTQVISAILHKTVSNDLERYARDSLFAPLGINNLKWDKTVLNVPKAGWGLYLTIPDMAKLGYLMLQNGEWNNEQIIPSSWIAKVTIPYINAKQNWDYGYQIWIPKNTRFNGYYFWGYYPPASKIIAVFPELDIVIVYVGEYSRFRELIESYLMIINEKARNANNKYRSFGG